MPREASPKQKAMLRFIGVSFHEPLAMDEASDLISDAIDSERYRERLEMWNRQKFKLHPDLYASDLAEHQAERLNWLYEGLNESDKRQFIKRVTKAEVREIITYLDQHFPDWDNDEVSGVWDYGMAALQQLYPSRVKKGYHLEFPVRGARSTALPSNSGGCLSVVVMFIAVVLLIVISLA